MKTLSPSRSPVLVFARLRPFALSTTLKNLVLIAVITGIAFFVLSPWMGLYEDDFVYIATPASWNLGDLANHLEWVVTTMPQGRPIGWLLPQIISYIGWQFGGLPVLYLVAYLVTVLNAGLFYFLLKRFAGETLALLGALALVLFPADTTRPFLMHAFGLQTSLTFLLLASHVYFRKRALSYVLAACCLLTYESAFLPFLFVPLLEMPWDRTRMVTLVRHLTICALLVVAALALRRVVGEARVSLTLSDPLQTVLHAGAGMIIGPVISLSTFGYRFLAPIFSENRLVWTGSVIAAVILILRFSGAGSWLWARARALSSAELGGDTADGNSGMAVDALPSLHFLIVGGLMLMSAYAFAFTHFPPTITSGRLTSVHFAAAIGVGILFGWLSTALLFWAGRAGLQWLAGGALGLYLAGLVGFGLVIQTHFRYAWWLEQQVWTRILQEAGDADSDNVILVENLLGVKTPFINPFMAWTAPAMLEKLYGSNSSSGPLPNLYFTSKDWKDYLFDQGDWILLDSPNLSAYTGVQARLLPGKFILLRFENGELHRVDEGLELNGKVLAPKPRTSDSLSERPHRRLFDFLITPMLN